MKNGYVSFFCMFCKKSVKRTLFLVREKVKNFWFLTRVKAGIVPSML